MKTRKNFGPKKAVEKTARLPDKVGAGGRRPLQERVVDSAELRHLGCVL